MKPRITDTANNLAFLRMVGTWLINNKNDPTKEGKCLKLTVKLLIQLKSAVQLL